MVKKIFEIKASKDGGKTFQLMATFLEGTPDRHGIPMGVAEFLRESESFYQHRRKDFTHIQEIITYKS